MKLSKVEEKIIEKLRETAELHHLSWEDEDYESMDVESPEKFEEYIEDVFLNRILDYPVDDLHELFVDLWIEYRKLI